MHFIREYPQTKKKDEKDFQVVTASYIGHRFRNEIEIFECEEAINLVKLALIFCHLDSLV